MTRKVDRSAEADIQALAAAIASSPICVPATMPRRPCFADWAKAQAPDLDGAILAWIAGHVRDEPRAQ